MPAIVRGHPGQRWTGKLKFRRLYEAHRAAVHAYFTGRTGDPQSAADLMQDVFLRVWQHLEKLDRCPNGRHRGVVFTVARNLSVDAHRHQHTQAGSTEQALAPRAASRLGPPPRPAPLSSLPSAPRSLRPGNQATLPEPQRITLTMAAAGEMTSAALAAALGGTRPAPCATGCRSPGVPWLRRSTATMTPPENT